MEIFLEGGEFVCKLFLECLYVVIQCWIAGQGIFGSDTVVGFSFYYVNQFSPCVGPH